MILACEDTATGWRALTKRGEIINVGNTEQPPERPDRIIMHGERIAVPAAQPGLIDRYLAHYNRSIEMLRFGHNNDALREIDAAIALAPTGYARFNRAIVLLSLGYWGAGFAEFEARIDLGLRDSLIDQVKHLPRWRGARGRMLLVHDAGFGDTIMLLRYVPGLRSQGIDVRLLLPPELRSLGRQLAPLGDEDSATVYCPIMSLLHLLKQRPDNTLTGAYLGVDPARIAHWRARLRAQRPLIGVAWSIGPNNHGDDSRAMPLAQMVEMIGPGVDLVSIQQQGSAEAKEHG